MLKSEECQDRFVSVLLLSVSLPPPLLLLSCPYRQLLSVQ